MSNVFSVTSLLKTLFSPWKKMVGEKGRGVEGLKLWLLDNFISRTVGFIVRLFMIFFFLIGFALYAVFAVFAIIFWFCMPAVLVGSFVYIFIGY